MGPTRLLAAALLHMRQPWHPLTIHLRSTCHPQSLDQNQETKTPTLRQPPPTVYSALTRLAPSPLMVSLFFVFVVCFFLSSTSQPSRVLVIIHECRRPEYFGVICGHSLCRVLAKNFGYKFCLIQSPSVCPVFGCATKPGTHSLGRVLANNFGYKFCVTHRPSAHGNCSNPLPPLYRFRSMSWALLQQPSLYGTCSNPLLPPLLGYLLRIKFFFLFSASCYKRPDREGDHCNPSHNPEILASPA